MLFERKLVVLAVDGTVYESDIRADNKAIRVPRDGYSGWEGHRWIKGFSVAFTTHRGVQDTTWAETRKEAIREAAYSVCPTSMHDYKLVK